LGDRVINATPGGKLKMYRRASIKDLV